MNKQRKQEYYQLIQNLLNCPDGKESEILTANTNLIDSDFILALQAVANYYAQQGQEKMARWLRNSTKKLNKELNLKIAVPDSEAYLPFLVNVIVEIEKSGGDRKKVYPLLEKNGEHPN